MILEGSALMGQEENVGFGEVRLFDLLAIFCQKDMRESSNVMLATYQQDPECTAECKWVEHQEEEKKSLQMFLLTGEVAIAL